MQNIFIRLRQDKIFYAVLIFLTAAFRFTPLCFAAEPNLDSLQLPMRTQSLEQNNLNPPPRPNQNPATERSLPVSPISRPSGPLVVEYEEMSRFIYGKEGDAPFIGDFNQDGRADRALFRNGEWIVDTDGDHQENFRIQFGQSGDIPVVGSLPRQMNKPGATKIAVFRAGTWIFDNNLDGEEDSRTSFGIQGDIPLMSDLNGDGELDLVVFRNGTWMVDRSKNGRWDGREDQRFELGQEGDIPIIGDFNGDGRQDIGVFRDRNFFIDTDRDGKEDLHIDHGAAGEGGVPVINNFHGLPFRDRITVFQKGTWITAKRTIRRGFDPDFSNRRIASVLGQRPATYFEDCPDGPGGKCLGGISPGGGFYNLATDIGGFTQAAKINSHDTFELASNGKITRQSNPFYFSWLAGGGGTPMTGRVEIDNLNWSVSDTPNVYLGLQHNPPSQGYLGGNNPMHTDGAFTTVTLNAGEGIRGPADPNAQARYLIAINWYSKELNRSIDIEFNLGNIPPVGGSVNPKWSSTARVARNDIEKNIYGEGQVQYIYLGAGAWGLPILSKENQTVSLKIFWKDVIRQLIRDGILDARAISRKNPRPVTFAVGMEQLGRLRNVMDVSNLKMRDIES